MKLKEIEEIMNNKPFCYILYFPNIDLRYLGLRVGKDRDPASLLKKYKTSSPKVKKLLREGNDAIVESIIYFETIDAAAEYESTMADGVVADPKWINQQSRKYCYTGIGKYYPRYFKK